ncbi:MAG: acetyl-CoA carboxylase carboxyltransferase subunit beta [Alphaproteobacteria bacterium]|nr:acetyl-CoA carboxylase carboxyltransferase subunit beta [Alphaproteobacteria bacterium]
MNWLTNFVRPTIRSLVRKRELPENLWEKCAGCEKMVFHRDLVANLSVCPHCDHHMRLGVRERLKSLFDRGEYELVAAPSVVADPLKFRDAKRYTERLKENRAKTGDDDAILVATGTMGRNNVLVAAQNFAFLGGSLGMAGGEALVTAAREAVARKAPLIAVSASGGARMQEGILSLMQMPRTIVAAQMVRDAGLPYIVVLTDPTTGGVTASFAMLGDVAIAEPGALIAFTGPRVIENTIKEKLPAGFQKAEYLLEHGMVDMVVHRRELRDTLIRVIDLLVNKDRAEAGADEGTIAIPFTPPAVYRGDAANQVDEMKRAAE